MRLENTFPLTLFCTERPTCTGPLGPARTLPRVTAGSAIVKRSGQGRAPGGSVKPRFLCSVSEGPWPPQPRPGQELLLQAKLGRVPST